jgi:hypothetical protein
VSLEETENMTRRIPMSPPYEGSALKTGWVVNLSWRLWLFGFAFGPDVFAVSVGPLMVGRVLGEKETP